MASAVNNQTSSFDRGPGPFEKRSSRNESFFMMIARVSFFLAMFCLSVLCFARRTPLAAYARPSVRVVPKSYGQGLLSTRCGGCIKGVLSGPS